MTFHGKSTHNQSYNTIHMPQFKSENSIKRIFTIRIVIVEHIKCALRALTLSPFFLLIVLNCWRQQLCCFNYFRWFYSSQPFYCTPRELHPSIFLHILRYDFCILHTYILYLVIIFLWPVKAASSAKESFCIGTKFNASLPPLLLKKHELHL